MNESVDAPEAQAVAEPTMPAIPAPPEPPYAAGSRVRCLISTGAWYAGGELRGRAGTVVRCAYFDHSLTEPFWDIQVSWDGADPPMLFHHAPDELELANN